MFVVNLLRELELGAIRTIFAYQICILYTIEGAIATFNAQYVQLA